ncbi:cupin domain-containing protein [Planomicrobium sp. CPCC 101110]|uniref:cupin domain-containing protein n=1 Tax=Planomicrobium sp. CPCC 101110 TaxID=2599619 RepID=UPI0016466E44|nr:cupin domain-containing protein [Planomicrobium sp. CPCC 101110]
MENAKFHHFEDDGNIPNNPTLPVILYPKAFEGNPEGIESVFNQNNWTNSWTNGVFDYHHYHSNTHEVLGVKSGTAEIQLGGESGQIFHLSVGDVVVLPAGTGHKKLSGSDDFQVVGAYPNGAEPDLKTGDREDRPDVLESILDAPLPGNDPVFGKEGPVVNNWT